jgi:sugar-specific transcriptional regulator TrmB
MSSSIIEQAKEQLSGIGFTQLEADVYLYLLSQGSGTGYGIAKGINKAIANVYKALTSLSAKGAVSYSSSSSKNCSAVPWQQFLASEQKHYQSTIENLSQCLQQLPAQQQDEEVYQLKNAHQAIDQSIKIIESAQSVLLLDLHPDAVPWFLDSIVDAANRGVEVRAKIYEAVELPGVIVTLRDNGKQVYDKTQDIEFKVCADGAHMMLALLSADGKNVIQAFETRSSLMNLAIYSGLMYEMILTELKRIIPSGDIAQAQKVLINTEHLHPFSSENGVFDQYKKRYHSTNSST